MEQKLDKVYTIAKSRDFKNILILIIAILSVLAINSLLPLLEGSASYTEQAVEVTYPEYVKMHEQDNKVAMTYRSKLDVKEVQKEAKEKAEAIDLENSIDLKKQLEEQLLEELTVKVYTKFFFQSILWWTNMALSALSIMIIFYACFNYIISRFKRRKQSYLDIKKEVDDAVQTSVDPITFEPFNEQFNYDRKVKQHIANVKYKKDKLICKTSYKIRTDETHKKHKRFINKLNEYDYQLSEDYIKSYVKDKKVKYFKYIYSTFVLSGYNSIGKTVDGYSLIKSDSAKISKDGIKKIILTILFTVVLAVLLTFTVDASIDKSWYWIVANVLAKITPLIFQVVMSYDYAETFMDEQVINNLIIRRSIILLYLANTRSNIGDSNG